VLDVLLCFYFA